MNRAMKSSPSALLPESLQLSIGSDLACEDSKWTWRYNKQYDVARNGDWDIFTSSRGRPRRMHPEYYIFVYG